MLVFFILFVFFLVMFNQYRSSTVEIRNLSSLARSLQIVIDDLVGKNAGLDQCLVDQKKQLAKLEESLLKQKAEQQLMELDVDKRVKEAYSEGMKSVKKVKVVSKKKPVAPRKKDRK